MVIPSILYGIFFFLKRAGATCVPRDAFNYKVSNVVCLKVGNCCAVNRVLHPSTRNALTSRCQSAPGTAMTVKLARNCGTNKLFGLSLGITGKLRLPTIPLGYSTSSAGSCVHNF